MKKSLITVSIFGLIITGCGSAPTIEGISPISAYRNAELREIGLNKQLVYYSDLKPAEACAEQEKSILAANWQVSDPTKNEPTYQRTIYKNADSLSLVVLCGETEVGPDQKATKVTLTTMK